MTDSVFKDISDALMILGLMGSSDATRDDAAHVIEAAHQHELSVEYAASIIATRIFRPRLLERISPVGNHAVCVDCWDAMNPSRPAYRSTEGTPHTCCYCRTSTTDGIYLRDAYVNTACTDVTCPSLVDTMLERLEEETT